ncbi:MAG TPA: hypothetical protein PLE99_04265 [Candidatus Thiothrix moscowensis]|nr:MULTISPECIES: hypothetical protein [unclassified Thiothrix]HRJ51961.1 hypothetical protein [Candidatus Thiothrix moscowensis]HRJ92276.1 hypothetical protein [Candidatus Thiothrix moscowensis]
MNTSIADQAIECHRDKRYQTRIPAPLLCYWMGETELHNGTA